MINQIFKILDNFFQFNSKLLTHFPNEEMNNALAQFQKPISEKFEDKFKISKPPIGINPTMKELEENISQSLNSLDPKEILEFFKLSMQNLEDNYELVFYTSPMYEKNIYERINPAFQDFVKNFYQEFLTLCNWYIKRIQTHLTIDKDISSIRIIGEEVQKLEEHWNETTFLDLVNMQDKIFSKIEQINHDEFKLYFSNWILNIADIIESRIKPILLSLLFMKKTSDGVKNNTILNSQLSLGQILSQIDPNKKFNNLWRLVIYRNARFHDGIDYHFDEQLKKRILTFHDKKSVAKIDIHTLILDFEKIYRTVNTIDLVIKIYCIKVKTHSDNPISEFNKKFRENMKELKLK